MMVPGTPPPGMPVPAQLLKRRRKTYRLRRRSYHDLPAAAEAADHSELSALLDEARRDKQEWIEKGAQLQDMAMRARTDLENVRRRVQREREDTRKTLTADLLGGFLPVLDHFDLAVRAAESSSDPRAILQGVVMIQRELLGLLQTLGLERIEDQGLPFDPTIHEAVATGSDPETPDQTILEVMRPGWRYGDRCLRPAMVKVNRVEEASEAKPPRD